MSLLETVSMKDCFSLIILIKGNKKYIFFLVKNYDHKTEIRSLKPRMINTVLKQDHFFMFRINMQSRKQSSRMLIFSFCAVQR